MKKNIYVLIHTVLFTLCCLTGIAQTNKCLNIGLNIGDPNRYNGAYSMFKNVMLSSDAFSTESIYGGTDNYSYIPSDANGYPNAGLPYSTTVYTNCCGMVPANAMTIKTMTMQECPRDFPWGPAAVTTTLSSLNSDSAGVYYVFWEGAGRLEFEWNYGGSNIIPIAGTYGTITTSGTSYYGGTKVPNKGIATIAASGITSTSVTGLHYCQIRIANYYNGDNPTNHGDPGLSGGLTMHIKQSAAAPYHIRNVAVVMPNARALDDHSIVKIDPSQPFHSYADPNHPEFFLNKAFNPMFINWLKPFTLLRFMVAMGANSIDYTYDQTWQTRKPKGYYSQSVFHDGRVGVSMAYEWLVDIANEAGADAWISASATGDINHYQQMAKLFHQNLNPELNVYLELGNEQWNFAGGFNTFFVLNAYGAMNNMGVSEASAIKEGQLWKAFYDEYGIDSLKCKRVMSGFAGNPDVTNQKLAQSMKHGINWDYFSTTWYFDANGAFTTGTYNANSTTPAQYNFELESRIAGTSFASYITSMSDFAETHKKKVLGYEGGSGAWEFAGNTQQDPALLSKFDVSVRHAYRTVLDTIRNHPEIEAVCQFNDFGGGASGPANGGWHGYGAIPSIMTDTSSTGNGTYAASFGTYAYTGTNKYAVWKELVSELNLPSSCSPQVTSNDIGPGNSIKFNNDRSQYINYTSAANLAGTGDYSFEIWVKPDLNSKAMDVLAFTDPANNSFNAIRIDGTNRISWVINNATGGSVVNLSGSLLTSNNWYHIAAVKQSNNYKLYINGAIVATGSGTGTYSSARVSLGASIVGSGTASNFFRGEIDEFRIWNGAAITTGSIQSFMCKKLTASHPNNASLSSYVVFNSISGNNLFDLKTGTYALNALNNFSTTTGVPFYVASGAPIGDESMSIYPGNWAGISLTYTNPMGGDIIQVSGIGNGLPDGAHLYVVNETPYFNALPQFYTSVGQTKYYGVFMANGDSPNYNIKYFYQGNPGASSTDNFNRLIKRGSSADPAWVNGGAIIDNITKSLTINCRETYRAEYNIGVRQANLQARVGSGTAISFNVGTLTGQGGKMKNFFRTDEYTVSFWARGSNSGSSGNVLWFGQPVGYGGGWSQNMYAVGGGGPTGYVNLSTRFNGLQYGGGNNGVPYGAFYEWNYYAVTKQGSELTLYINGMPTGGGPDPSTYFFSEMNIGTHAWEYSAEFEGDIDEMSVWSKALSLTEIRDLMCKKITPEHPDYCNLTAYFKFDEGAGAVIENAVGGGDMILTGPTWITSGAALGDVSTYNYSSPNAVTLTHPDGDDLKLDYLLRGSEVLGTQMYRIDDNPYYTGTIPSGITSEDQTRYWGVYEIGQQEWNTNAYTMNYKLTYDYAANTNINLAQENTLTALERKENDNMDWGLPGYYSVDNVAKKLTIIPDGYSITGIDATANTFTVPNHGFQTCDLISYYFEGTPSGSVWGAYSQNSQFHIRVIDANTISLHTYWNTSDCASGANPEDLGTLGSGKQFFIKVRLFKRDEFWMANSNPAGFANSTAVPTIAGITGKKTVCQGEQSLTYSIKAPVDINAKEFIWTGSSGLAVGVSNKDTVSVSIIASGGSVQTLSVVGVNKYGKTAPAAVYSITVTGTGALSADVIGSFNVCGPATGVTYSIAGVSPVPISYIWAITGNASFATSSTNNITALNFGTSPGTSILSVYGNYACGTALINTKTIETYKSPDISLQVTGEVVCAATTALDPRIYISGSELGVVYSAYDITSGSVFVGSVTGNGTKAQIYYPRALLTPWSSRTIQVTASNGPCAPPSVLTNTTNIMLSNTLTGAELAAVQFDGPTLPACYNGGINLYNITLTGTKAGVTYAPYVFDYNQNYPYYEFSYIMGNEVMATGSSVIVTVQPNVFPYWFSFNRPNTIGGMAFAPGCPSQKLPNNFNMVLKRSTGVAIPSKIAGFPKGLRQPGDDDDYLGICSANTGTFYTTAWGGNPDVFVGREVFGTSAAGNPVITITSKTISLADIDLGDVLYTISSVGEAAGYGFSFNDKPLYVISKTANTLQVSFTYGGAAASPNYDITNFRFWVPVTVPTITNGSQYLTIPAKYVGHGLRLYSQVVFSSASSMPAPMNASADHTYYVISINGNNFMFSQMPTQWTAGQQTSLNYNVERGTLALTNGSNVVNGTGTRFGGNLYGGLIVQAGDILRDLDDAVIGTVQSVVNAGQLILTANYTGPTRAGVSYGFMRPAIFNGSGQAVVLSAPTDAWDGSGTDKNGFDWKVTPIDAVQSIIGLGGNFSAATGEYFGNLTGMSAGINTAAGQGFTNRVKNSITVIWNPTFAGTAYVAAKARNQCGETVYDNREAATPGYERTQVYVNIRAKVPGTPDPISFSEIPLCKAPGNTIFTTVAQTSGGYQWQILNAGGSSMYQQFYACGGCNYDPVSTVLGLKSSGGTTCTGSIRSDCAQNGGSVGVSWDNNFTGIATIRVRAYGCDEMTASPWVVANITINGASDLVVNVAGPSSRCVGAAPSQYSASSSNPGTYYYFLLPDKTPDIYSGMVAAYALDGNANNYAFGIFTKGAAGDGSGGSYMTNRFGTASSAMQGSVQLPFGMSELGRSYTVSAWIKPASYGSDRGIIGHYGTCHLDLDNGRLAFRTHTSSDPNNATAYNNTFSGILPLNVWQQVALTVDQFNGGTTITGYVNGIKTGSDIMSNTNFALYGWTGWYAIIGRHDPWNNPFNDPIDDVIFYNKSLSASEMLYLYTVQSTTGFTKLVDPSPPIGSISNPTSGVINWVPTFTGIAKVGVIGYACSGYSRPVYYIVTTTSIPTITGVSVTDPTSCAAGSSGTILITIAGFTGAAGSGFDADLNGGGFGAGNVKNGTIDAGNVVTINSGLPTDYQISQLRMRPTGGLCIIAPDPYPLSTVIGGIVPPSVAVPVSLQSVNPHCSGNDAVVRLTGSENGITYYAQIAGNQVSSTLLGNGGIIDLTIAGANVLTSSGANISYIVNVVAVLPACNSFTLTGTAQIDVQSQAYAGTIIGGNVQINPGSSTGVMTLTGQTGNISTWQNSFNGAAYANISSTSGLTSYSENPTVPGIWAYQAIMNSTACNSTATTQSVYITVSGNGGIVRQVSGNGAVCLGGSPGLLTLTGYSGNILRWEVSSDGGRSYTTVNNTVDSYTPGSLSPVGIWQFRAIVYGGNASVPQAITVSSPPVINADYGNSPYCSSIGTIPAPAITTPGGTFSRAATSLGITVDQNTGKISNITDGVGFGKKLIYYTVSIPGCAAIQKIVVLTITGAPKEANLSYTSTEDFGSLGNAYFCKAKQASPDTNLNLALHEGYFTSSSLPASAMNGLFTGSGIIDLKKVTADGAYDITYTYNVDKYAGCDILPIKTYTITVVSSMGGKAVATPGKDICEGSVTSLALEYPATANAEITTNQNVIWKEKINGQWQQIGTTAILATGTLSGVTHYYQASTQFGTCPVAASQADTVEVSALPVAGKLQIVDPVTGSTLDTASTITLCNLFSTTITSTGSFGTLQWLYTSGDKNTKLSDWSKSTDSGPSVVTPEIEQHGAHVYMMAALTNGACKTPIFTAPVKVSQCEQNRSIPNALTPTTGDKNSSWDLSGLNIRDEGELKVFNRYGTEVYKATGKQMKESPWDGSSLPAGTYYYVIKMHNKLGDNNDPIRGAVTIIK